MTDCGPNNFFVSDKFDYTMKNIRRKKVISYIKYAQARFPCIFQQKLRPSGSCKEAKNQFLGKHKLNYLKIEIQVLPYGFSISARRHFGESVSDVEILQDVVNWHPIEWKRRGEKYFSVVLMALRSTLTVLVVLSDNRYCGTEEQVGALRRDKKHPRVVIILTEKKNNKEKLSDRLILYTYFENQCAWWSIVDGNYR